MSIEGVFREGFVTTSLDAAGARHRTRSSEALVVKLVDTLS